MSQDTPRKSTLARLDDSVRWTGIPALAEWHPRRRRLRWTSLIPIILATIGFVAGFGHAKLWWGYALVMLGFGVANFMPILGPLKPWGSLERVDEFDRILRERSFLMAFRILGFVAVLSLWLTIGISSLQEWDASALRWTCMQLAFLLATIYSAGPTCYASWTMLLPEEDEED